ncbi:MAG: transporter associated domain-containing protein, partial [Terracidiphilus sp.]
LEVQYNIAIREDPSYSTVAGFVLARLGFIPRGGEGFEEDGYRFTVMEMDRRRVSRVKIKRLQTPEIPPGAQPIGPTSSAASTPSQAAAEQAKVHAAAVRERRAR